MPPLKHTAFFILEGIPKILHLFKLKSPSNFCTRQINTNWQNVCQEKHKWFFEEQIYKLQPKCYKLLDTWNMKSKWHIDFWTSTALDIIILQNTTHIIELL